MRSTYSVKVLKQETMLIDFGEEIPEDEVKERIIDGDYEDVIDISDEEMLDIIDIE